MRNEIRMCITTYTNRVCKDFISQHENIGNSNRQLFVQLQCSTTVLTVAAAAVLAALRGDVCRWQTLKVALFRICCDSDRRCFWSTAGGETNAAVELTLLASRGGR